MELEPPYSLGARWIHPILSRPLEHHWINVADGKVESISEKPAYQSTHSLGENKIILPAVVNAHTHLELSQLESPLEVPSRSMSDWVTALLAFRRSPAYNAVQGIQQAACQPELLESTIAVADIIPPTLEMADSGLMAAKGAPLWLPFIELIGWRDNHEHFTNKQGTFPTRHTFGLSPHAPHTVCPTLLEQALNQNMPIAIHLAETLEELQLLRHHTGPLLERMRRADPEYNPQSVFIGKCPMDYLQLLSAAPHTLVIHGNYLDDDELRFLAAHRETMSVVYCPRSHAYFRHTPYPLQKMLAWGVRVLLGTDSLASVPNLNLVDEMQFILKNHPTIPAETIYHLGTWEGASALSLPEGFGTIQPGSPARFAILET